MITVSNGGRPGKMLHRLTTDELNALAAAITAVKVNRVVLRLARRRPVPPRVWKPIADIVADMHGITAREMLYQGHDYKFSIPRARFWRVLRALVRKSGKRRYTLTAIAAITGHDHTSVMHAMQHGTADRDYSAIINDKYRRARVDHTGETFGQLQILGSAPRPEGRTHYRWWKFRCACGKEGVASTGALANGKVTCGHGRGFGDHAVTHIRPPAAAQAEPRL